MSTSDDSTLPESVQKRLAGMRAKLREYKTYLRRYQDGLRVQDYTLRYILKVERENRRFEAATWNVCFDSPNTTAAEIKEYLTKVRKGLGLDE